MRLSRCRFRNSYKCYKYPGQRLSTNKKTHTHTHTHTHKHKMKVPPPPLSPSLGRREPAVYMKAPCKVGVMMGQRACHKTRGLSTPITFTHITNTKTLRIQSARDGKSNTTQHWVVLLVGLSYMPVCSFVLFSRSVFPRDTNCRRDRFHQQ